MSLAYLYKECENNKKFKKSETGALIAYSGEKTGRSPKDKRIVYDENTKDIDWGNVNIPMSTELYQHYKKGVIEYLKMITEKRIYIVEGYAGWENKRRIKVICVNPYHAMFMKNMLITNEKMEGEIDFTIYAVGELKLSNIVTYDKKDENDLKYPLSETLVGFNFTDKSMLIMGTEYAGEIKKAVFTYMLYEMPKEGKIPLHSSANIDENGNTTLFLGLSGTGKTTLSSDEKSRLIGDDEHIWDEKGIYNIEGGCYAKCAYLSKEKEPQIYNAIKYGAVLENVIVKNNEVDYNDISITENTRCSYPLEHVENSVIPAIGKHPKNIIFLTCDATGLLPLVSELEDDEAIFMFLAGYTSKTSGTEIGIKEPEPTFSTCFAGPFIVWQPKLYAKLLEKKIKEHGTKVWLVNTGYNAKGKRYPLEVSREIINRIKSGDIFNLKKNKLKYFNITYYTKEEEKTIYDPINMWDSRDEYYENLYNLRKNFIKNNSKLN